MSPGKLLAIIIFVSLCMLSIGGCISDGPAGAPANVSGSVLSFDITSLKAAALARGIKSANVTDSEAQVWRYIHEYKDGKLVLLGDSIYDRVGYETTVDGETYTITMVKEGYTGWTIARMYSASDTFIETDGAKSWLDFYR